MQDKLKALYEKLIGYKKLAIASSGGLDSSFLFYESVKVLGAESVLGIHISSPIVFSGETEFVKKIASELRTELVIVNHSPFEIEGFTDNPPYRCYVCKKAYFEIMKREANKRGFERLADGATASDLTRTRPGMLAAQELNIIHPLREAKLTKEEIRIIARSKGYDFWSIPPQSCAMTRFPFGFKVNQELIEKVKICEDKIRSTGFWLVRLRYGGHWAKVEVVDTEFEKAQNMKDILVDIIRKYFNIDIRNITIERYIAESQR